ncbi:MAG: hypothetical protein CME64_15275 [Halobacteriovoraceae bacterium]|nr:hypothetical protein [Halobacteriovoraceae bacterium]
MNIKEVEKAVARIQSHLFQNSNSFSVGMLKSHFKGAGLQFKEHQIYNPGDDVRFIDWKLSAKTANTFVKTFEEERNIEIVVVLDLCDSMLIGYKGVSKLQASLEIACLLYLLAEKTKDNVKIVLFTDQVEILPGASGQKGIVLLMSVLQRLNIVNAEGVVNPFYRVPSAYEEKKKLAQIKSLVARGKEAVLLSDFNALDNFDELNKLFYRKNMHCFQLTSPIDEQRTSQFSIFTKLGGKRVLAKTGRKKESGLKGRYRKISVKDRYLESFIREML